MIKVQPVIKKCVSKLNKNNNKNTVITFFLNKIILYLNEELSKSWMNFARNHIMMTWTQQEVILGCVLTAQFLSLLQSQKQGETVAETINITVCLNLFIIAPTKCIFKNNDLGYTDTNKPF